MILRQDISSFIRIIKPSFTMKSFVDELVQNMSNDMLVFIKGTWVQILMKGTFSLLKTRKPKPGDVNIYNTEMSNHVYPLNIIYILIRNEK